MSRFRFPNPASLGVRAKFQILLCGVIVSVGIASIHHARREMHLTLGHELDGRGLAIAEDLAAGTTDPLLTGDLVEVNRWVKRAASHNKDIRYILLFGPRGELVMSTFAGRLPAGLRSANVLEAGQAPREKLIRTEEGLIRDFAVPVLGGQAGFVRVGMSDASLRSAVDRHSLILAVLISLAAAFGLAASYWLARYLTDPISQLASAVQLVGMGDLGHEIRTSGNDEIGRLTQIYNATTRALAEKEKARKALLVKVITSQEEERKRLARDLHDEVVQLLISVQFTLEALSRRSRVEAPEAPEYLEVAKQVVAKAIAETRRIIYDLRPAILDSLGLGPAIEQFARSRLESRGVEVALDTRGLPDKLDPLVETAVFRIVQEACMNTAKYAGARSVRISLEATDGHLAGEVADDGTGFEESRVLDLSTRPATGLGIQGMRERAGLLGGTFAVRSRPGRGTVVSFTVPLDGSSKEE